MQHDLVQLRCLDWADKCFDPGGVRLAGEFVQRTQRDEQMN